MRQSCDCANNGDKENAGCLKIRQADFFKTGVFCQPLLTHTPSRALAGEKSRDRFGLFDMTQDVSVTRTCSRDFPL